MTHTSRRLRELEIPPPGHYHKSNHNKRDEAIRKVGKVDTYGDIDMSMSEA